MKRLYFSLSFEKSWIIKKKNDDELPIKKIVRVLSDKANVSITYAGVSDCEGYFIDDKTEGEIKDLLAELLKELYPEDAEDSYEINIEQVNVEEKEEEQDNAEPDEESKKTQDREKRSAEGSEKEPEKKPEKKFVAKPEKPEKTIDDVLKEINEMVGGDDFKLLSSEACRIIPLLKENKLEDIFAKRCYLVSINNGYGLTSFLEKFNDMILCSGLFSAKQNPMLEIRIPAAKTGMSGSPFDSALQYYESSRFSNEWRVVCIDISEWMTKTSDKEFRDFLKAIEASKEKRITFFRVPFVEKNILDEITGNICDVLTVRPMSIVPFSNDQLKESAVRLLDTYNYSMDDAAWDIYDSRIIEEKSDGRFYGIKTVKKVINEIVYSKINSDSIKGSHNNKIIAEDISGIIHSNISKKSGMEQLKELVGMESIQKQVEEIVAQIEASLNIGSLETPCIHMRFVGNPGTGKTTVARILGQILKEKGILRNGNFFEYSGRDFCGRYVGETAPKTAAMCRDAYGSVLFIDEAYSLYRDDGISSVDYGREAIDTLIAEMENHRSDLMVIMAGYPDDMEGLMKANVGLKSRMPFEIEFPPYSREQLYDIFVKMVKQSFECDDAFLDCAKQYFDELSDEFLKSKDFSNARFVRNLYERTWGKAVLRCQMQQTVCRELSAEDFNLAVSDKEFKVKSGKKNKPIGFI